MRVFLAGATGVLGRRLIPNLLERGHSVIGTSNTKTKLSELRKLGVEAVLMNGIERDSVVSAVNAARPDVVVNEMTALSSVRNLKHFDRVFNLTNRLRAEGTAHLLAAAKQCGAKKIVVQSFTGWPFEPSALATSEDIPFERDLPAQMIQSQRAIQKMEEMVVSAQPLTGVVLRYGYFYGPGTSFDYQGDLSRAVRRRAFPLIGGGSAVWSLVHIDDAAEATRLAIEGAPSGIYNIADDRPATVSEWLPALARLLDAKRPVNVPAWLGKLFIGESGLYMMTRARGALNGKAKQALNWKPVYPDWRKGLEGELKRVS